MQTHFFNDYKMTLHNTGKIRDGHAVVRYTFSQPDGLILFQGEDFQASPLHKAEGLESAIALLTFLTLKPGDTDSEYFDSYTPVQLAFANSFECEELQLYTVED